VYSSESKLEPFIHYRGISPLDWCDTCVFFAATLWKTLMEVFNPVEMATLTCTSNHGIDV
jgi:hypothetical protein